MTKAVTVTNADISDFGVVVQVWDKGYPAGEPDVMVSEHKLPNLTSTYGLYLTSTRYLLVKET